MRSRSALFVNLDPQGRRNGDAQFLRDRSLRIAPQPGTEIRVRVRLADDPRLHFLRRFHKFALLMRRTESGHAATLLVVLLAAACERGEFDRRPLHVYAASSPTDAFADGHVAGSDRARLLGGFTMVTGRWMR